MMEMIMMMVMVMVMQVCQTLASEHVVQFLWARNARGMCAA
jgi:hypothetical protein